MDITLDKKENNEATLSIRLFPGDYEPKIAQKVKQYRKQVNLKGFRPGKVPAGVIKKMYGKAIKVEEINELLSQSVPNYIQENDLKVVGEPLPDLRSAEEIDWENQSDFSFSYDLGLVNDFSYDLSDQVSVTKHTIKVTDETIDESIASLRKRFSTNESVDESQLEDTLLGTIQIDADTTNETEINTSVVPEEKQEKFIGLKVGDSVTFNIRENFPEDTDVAFLLGKQHDEVADVAGDFTFTVSEINRPIPAELNQEFFDQIFGPETVSTEEEFREKVRENIKENYDRESDTLLSRSIRKKYIDQTDIQLPSDFLKRWILSRQDGEVNEEQIDEQFDDYLQDLKWSLISEKIAKDEEIQANHEDVKNKARELVLSQFGMMGSEFGQDERFDPIVDNYLKGENGNNYMQVFSQVQSEKVFDYLKEKVTVEQKEVTVEEFNQVAEETK